MWKFICKICSRHDIAEILVKLALNTNQSIDRSISQSLKRYRVCGSYLCTQKNLNKVLDVLWKYINLFPLKTDIMVFLVGFSFDQVCFFRNILFLQKVILHLTNIKYFQQIIRFLRYASYCFNWRIMSSIRCRLISVEINKRLNSC